VNICTGRKTSLRRLAAIFAEHHPRVEPPRHAAPRAGDIRHSVGNPARAKAELDFEPEWTIDRGLAELIQP
jgi:UDP-glucose 4-epimerase